MAHNSMKEINALQTDSVSLYDLAVQWCERKKKEGIIEFSKADCNYRYIRFRTGFLCKEFPEGDDFFKGFSIRNNKSCVFYEIAFLDRGFKSTRFHLSFDTNHLPLDFEEKCSTMVQAADEHNILFKNWDKEYKTPHARPLAVWNPNELSGEPNTAFDRQLAVIFEFEAIIQGMLSGRTENESSPRVSYPFFPEEADTAECCCEGALTQVIVNRYERSAEARENCIKQYGAFCLACGFDFEKFYGECGKGFIHVHHLKPISEVGDSYMVDYKKDLIPVCPNCHAMLHRGMTLEKIREIAIQKGKQ